MEAYIKKEPKITKKYIYELENEFIRRYKEVGNNQFSCPEFDNLFACLFVFLRSSLKTIADNEYSLIWSITQSLELIKNCSQKTTCTNTEISKCPKPDINLGDSIYYINKGKSPCINNVYQTPYEGAVFPYAYCIRVLVRVMHTIDMINLYELSKLETDKKQFYNSPYAYIYFRNRYEYYLDYLLDNAPNIFILPILQSVGATDLLNIRGSRIQICGVLFKKTFVDEDFQSPGNFFWHDINHARRTYQNNIWYAQQKRITLDDLYTKMKADVDKILPLNSWLTGTDKKWTTVIKILLFEIVHEDALPFILDELLRDILYEVGECYPYEKAIQGKKKPHQRNNIRFYEQGATTMATLYNKIRHKFFEYETPIDAIVKTELRNTDDLTKGTLILIRRINELQGKSDPNITYDRIATLIASQEFSHHKDEKLPGIEFDDVFSSIQESVGLKSGKSMVIGGMKKVILGKEKRIYKLRGDRKEYVKCKGKLITVNEYKSMK